MDRRRFVAVIGGALAAPLARAQRPGRVHRIGWLAGFPAPVPPERDALFDAFLQRMRELGYEEGRNLKVEQRYAGAVRGTAGDLAKQVTELATDLVRIPVDVIVANNTYTTDLARKVTRTIPIVMGASANPVAVGVIASLSRPGGNVTGSTLDTADITAKRLQLLKEMVPGLRRVAAMHFARARTFPVIAQWLQDSEAAARALQLELVPVDLPVDDREWEGVFRQTAAAGLRAATLVESNIYLAHRAKIAELALRHRIATVFFAREQAEEGGLITYGAEVTDLYRRTADYVDKILKGANPANIPVEQPTRFTLAVNLKTAAALGIKVPQSILLRADRVIE